MWAPKSNNFDLIRVVAALQVAVYHMIAHLRLGGWDAGLKTALGLFPGVPIFFFISGFLISRSFEKNPIVADYALNRFLRIYPGMAVCFVLSVTAAWLAGYFVTIHVPFAKWFPWALAQLSIGQFYNPDFMRRYGVGVLNGSMWTITVELQFYLLVPVLYAVLRRKSSSRATTNAILLAVGIFFLFANQLYIRGASGHAHEIWYKCAGVSFVPWFYMFLVGVLFQRNFAVLHEWFAGKFTLLFASYCAVVSVASGVFDWSLGNTLHPAIFLALCIVTFTAAFSATELSDTLLARNDLSYGVYIYHMPVVNLLLAAGLGYGWVALPMAIGATLILAWVSWQAVEKPALSLKKHPAYRHGFAVPSIS